MNDLIEATAFTLQLESDASGYLLQHQLVSSPILNIFSGAGRASRAMAASSHGAVQDVGQHDSIQYAFIHLTTEDLHLHLQTLSWWAYFGSESKGTCLSQPSIKK